MKLDLRDRTQVACCFIIRIYYDLVFQYLHSYKLIICVRYLLDDFFLLIITYPANINIPITDRHMPAIRYGVL